MINKNYHTGVKLLGYDLIIQKLINPREVRVSITSDVTQAPKANEVGTIVSYLGEEGFFDYNKDLIDDDFESDSARIHARFLKRKKFKSLEIELINHYE